MMLKKSPMSIERVQKILAQAGISSRRKAEELITLGLVTINGKTAKLGDKAEFGTDAIKVNGKLLLATATPVYLIFNKPRGVISMMADPEGRPTLTDYLSKMKTRVYPVGRMDFNSEGLLILTNDGAFTEALQNRDDVPRVYHIKIKGHVTKEMLQRLERGARPERKLIKPHSVRLIEELNKKSRIEIVFLGANTMDLKAYFEQKGFLVERMVRTAIGHLTLRGLDPGSYRAITKDQAQALIEQPELGIKKLAQEIAKAKPIKQRVRPEFQTKESAKAAMKPLSGKPAVKPLEKPAPRTGNRPRPGREAGMPGVKRRY